MKLLLHPTDFSMNASKALKMAYTMAKRLKMALTIMHVADVPTIMNSEALPSFSEMEDSKRAIITEKLKKYFEMHLGGMSSVSEIRFSVRFSSSPESGILNAINEFEPEMVVVGTKGQSKLKEVLMGSTTKKLIAVSPSAVLAVPENTTVKEISNIVFASDFNEYDITVLKRVTGLLSVYNAVITVLHVFMSEKEADKGLAIFKQQVGNYLKDCNIKYDFKISNDIEVAIADYLSEHEVDMLVMFEKGKGMINRIYEIDLVRKFAIHTAVPLLSYNTVSFAQVEKSL